MKAIAKACTIRASSIGDCLMGKYLLEQVHHSYPEAICTIIVASRVGMIRDLLAAYPWLSVQSANRKSFVDLFRAFRKVSPSDFTVTQYTGRGQFSTPSKLFARLITRRNGLIGFGDPWRWNTSVYDHVIPFNSKKALIEHEQLALNAAGIPVTFPKPVLAYTAIPEVHGRLDLPKNSYMLVHLFAGTNGRGFTYEKRQSLVRAVCEEFGQRYVIVLTGSKDDAPFAKESAIGTNARVIAGQTSVQELANIIAGSAGVLSIDTGVAHMAAQLGKALVVVRACFAYNWWMPAQYEGPITVLAHDSVCEEVGHVHDKASNCLNSVTTEEVLGALRFRLA